MRSRKLLALLFCLITFPAIAGYMTLLGAGVGSIAPVVSWVSGTDAFPSTLSFSRTSNATMFDSTGKLTYAPNNLLTQSNNFSNAAWNQNATVSIAGGVSDPVGGSAASTVTATANNAIVGQGVVVGASLPGFTVGIWARRRTGSGAVYLYGPDSNAPGRYAMALSSSWQFFPNNGSSNGDTKAYIAILMATSGDAVDLYAGVLSRVTYETTPRPGDQVITTSSAYYGPRIDYDPNTLAVKGLLIEEARTNLAIQSEALSGASWVVGGATKSTDGTLYLNGSTANKFTATAINNNHSVSSAATVAVALGQAYTQSFFVKAGTHSKVAVNVGAAANWAAAVFDISGTSSGVATQTGAGSDTAVSGVSTYLGGGWFRLALTFTASATGGRFVECQMVPATTGNTFGSYGEVIWLAAGTENFYVGQPQLESGSFATSYIPTAAASVTRVADVVQFTGAAATAVTAAAGSLLVEAEQGSETSAYAGGTRYALYKNGNGATQIGTYNGSAILNSGVSPAVGSVFRAGLAWNAAGRSISANGSAPATDANTANLTAPVYLGSLGSIYWINGHIKSFAIYNQRLPDATLQSKSVVGASYAANDNGIRFANNDNLPVHWRLAL